MTNDEQMPDDVSLSPEHGVVDALIDGERVEVQALRDALARADVRDYFVDALMLRQLAQDMEPIRLAMPAPAEPREEANRPIRWITAAVVIIATAAGSYIYGRHERMPVVSPMSVEIVMEDMPPPAAPAPTHVIQLQPSVNWTRINGGD